MTLNTKQSQFEVPSVSCRTNSVATKTRLHDETTELYLIGLIWVDHGYQRRSAVMKHHYSCPLLCDQRRRAK